jgi:serine/threonine protein kinase
VMYEKILKGKLTFPPDMSEEAKDLLGGMLARKPKNRLGSNGMSDFYDHPFFADINWEKLFEKKVTPPFLPETTGQDTDIQNVDPEFKNQGKVEPETPATHAQHGDVLNFSKFTFAPADGAEGMVEDPSNFD